MRRGRSTNRMEPPSLCRGLHTTYPPPFAKPIDPHQRRWRSFGSNVICDPTELLLSVPILTLSREIPARGLLCYWRTRRPCVPSQLWRPQNRSHRKAQPPATIAQERSPPLGDTHQAAVRLPTPSPPDVQRNGCPVTRTCPSLLRPTGLPISLTRASRAASALALGHGWFERQVPPNSLAAMPARRMRGPSSHHMGPSPSHTRTGVQTNCSPAGTTTTCAATIRLSSMPC
jgi:hypothetical protein